MVLIFLMNLIQGQLAEAVETGGDQDDVFVSLDLVHPVERVVQGVKQIRFGEARDAQLIQRAATACLSWVKSARMCGFMS